MLGVQRSGPSGSYLDISDLFPGDFFAYFTLRDYAGGTDVGGLARFIGALGGGGVAVVGVKQVHSGLVAEARETPCEADAVVVRERGVAARVLVADCVPVLLAREDGGAWAAVHAGWKGTLAGIAASAARLLGAPAHPLRAYVGPAVGPCCYAVPEERRRSFAEAHPACPPDVLGPRGRLDLPAINRWMLEDAGLRSEAIAGEACCTACSPALFCSYRRDGESAGRMVALIGRPPQGGWPPEASREEGP